MNYITAEQFLSLPKEVQKVFMDWWEIEEGDLIYLVDEKETHQIAYAEEDIYGLIHHWYYDFEEDELMITGKCYDYGYPVIPLFRLDQLWEFIEDITEDRVYVTNYPHQFRGVGLDEIGWNSLNTNLLQAMWDLAIKVAREWLKDE